MKPVAVTHFARSPPPHPAHRRCRSCVRVCAQSSVLDQFGFMQDVLDGRLEEENVEALRVERELLEGGGGDDAAVSAGAGAGAGADVVAASNSHAHPHVHGHAPHHDGALSNGHGPTTPSVEETGAFAAAAAAVALALLPSAVSCCCSILPLLPSLRYYCHCCTGFAVACSWLLCSVYVCSHCSEPPQPRFGHRVVAPVRCHKAHQLAHATVARRVRLAARALVPG